MDKRQRGSEGDSLPYLYDCVSATSVLWTTTASLWPEAGRYCSVKRDTILKLTLGDILPRAKCTHKQSNLLHNKCCMQ